MKLKMKIRIRKVFAVLLVFTQAFTFLPISNIQVKAASPAQDISKGYTFQHVTIGGGGYVTGLVVHPNDSGIVYARTDVGGAYKWNEDTQSWTQLIDIKRMPADFLGSGSGAPGTSETQAYAVDSIGLDPNNPNIVFIACGANGNEHAGYVLRSTNGGGSFEMTNIKVGHDGNGAVRTVGERFAVDPNNSNLVYFGSR